jgi:hypothetical protein
MTVDEMLQLQLLREGRGLERYQVVILLPCRQYVGITAAADGRNSDSLIHTDVTIQTDRH